MSAHTRLAAEMNASVLRSPLLPVIRTGVAAMPPAEAFSVMLGIIAAMIAGVAFCAADRPNGHPVQETAQKLLEVLPALAERPQDCRLGQLFLIAEEVGAQIWRLAAFQADRELKAGLEELVIPICQPAGLIQHSAAQTAGICV